MVVTYMYTSTASVRPTTIAKQGISQLLLVVSEHYIICYTSFDTVTLCDFICCFMGWWYGPHT